MDDDDDENGADSRHQEHDVEPPMVEIELQVPEYFRDYGPVLEGHVHPHEQDHGHEVHAHDLREQEDDKVGALGAGNPDEELGHGEEETARGRHDDGADLGLKM